MNTEQLKYRIVFDYMKANYLVQYYSAKHDYWFPLNNVRFHTLKDATYYLKNMPL
jgi:hypothetical protein